MIRCNSLSHGTRNNPWRCQGTRRMDRKSLCSISREQHGRKEYECVMEDCSALLALMSKVGTNKNSSTWLMDFSIKLPLQIV